MKRQCSRIVNSRIHPTGPVLAGLLLAAVALNASAAVTLDAARWNAGRDRLVVAGTGVMGETVTVVNAYDPAQILGSKQLGKSSWRISSRHPDPVPCAVSVRQSNGDTAGPLDVANRPADCAPASPPSGNTAPVCHIDSPAGNMTIATGGTVHYTGTVTDTDGNLSTIDWQFAGGSPGSSDLQDPGDVTYGTAGVFVTTLVATDTAAAACVQQNRTITVEDVPPPGGDLVTDPVAERNLSGNTGYKVLAANDLGMHCADLDDQIFSILPPFNVLHAQVIEMGDGPNLVTTDSHPRMSIVYSAASNPDDPIFDPANPTLPPIMNPPAAALAGTGRAAVSINSTSQNDTPAGLIKGNFWNTNPLTGNPFGYDAYDNIFFGLLNPAAIVTDTGLPVPDSVLLPGCLTNPASCDFGQQEMPGIDAAYVDNVPKPFDRFDRDFNFFSSVLPAPLGSVVRNVNWWAADGITVLPIDDAGRVNAYPLMRVQAKDSSTVVASTDVVLPVASEADCQNCHVEPLDCVNPDLPLRIQNDACLGAATSGFQVITLDDAPPGMTTEQQLLNTAKINILRLHDVRHGSEYPGGANGWGDGGGCNAADNPNDASLWNANCLANSTPVQCSQCHYSPALDLAQLGPTDDPASQVFQATVNHSMSAVMHGHHGELQYQGAPLFPDMPSPAGRSADTAETILGETCYQCHPGKRTRCLRGAMFSGGVVCQDCHGQMADVGLDFTTGGTRVPWASEPKCQSCHTGDAVNPDHPAGAIVAGDGIRLLQAYTTDANAPTLRPDSRFAENENLFRLSGNGTTALATQGHQGIMCEGCHGSTHAVWPNANPFANDNVAAKQLQGHSGTLVECDTCHSGNLGNTLGGPHGLHPVGNTGFAGGGHEGLAEGNLNACAACHGSQGQGTVLSRAAVARTITWTHDGNTRTEQIAAGDYVGCDLCHGNPFTGGGGDD